MKLRVEADAPAAAVAAAAFIAARAREAAATAGRFSLALSGGSSPLPMFDALADSDIPWQAVHLYQVDERLVPADSAQRNLRAIRRHLIDRVAIPSGQLHAMPVGGSDPDAAAGEYAATLRRTLAPGGVLDLVHLGLGADGHTASLLPGDPAAESAEPVIVSQRYQGTPRLSLSAPVLSAARERVWLVTGADKLEALVRLLDGDVSIPAARVDRRASIVFTDLAPPGTGNRHAHR